MHELVEGGSQFLIATHAPIVLAYPGSHVTSSTTVSASCDGCSGLEAAGSSPAWLAPLPKSSPLGQNKIPVGVTIAATMYALDT